MSRSAYDDNDYNHDFDDDNARDDHHHNVYDNDRAVDYNNNDTVANDNNCTADYDNIEHSVADYDDNHNDDKHDHDDAMSAAECASGIRRACSRSGCYRVDLG